MGFEWVHSFELDNGIAINDTDGNTIFVGGGLDSPIGSDAPIGSFYFQSNGLLWKKYDVPDSAWRLFPNAEEVPFDNSSNGFINNTVQGAIEEAKNSGTSSNTLSIQLSRRGNTSNGWLYFDDSSILSNRTPLRLLNNYRLISVLFTNEITLSDVTKLKCYSQDKDSAGDISTSDTLEFEITSNDTEVTKNANGRIWNFKADSSNYIIGNKQYGFKISLDNGNYFNKMKNVHIILILQEI